MYFFYVKVNDIRYIIQKGRAFMTIVESFERAPLNNILSALESRAEKIIFLGDPAHMERHMVVYKKLLKIFYNVIIFIDKYSRGLLAWR